MYARSSIGFIACVAALAACGARSPLEPGGEGAADPAGGQASGGESHASGGDGGGAAGGGPAAVPQCLCPNLPGYAACVLPLMCCPVVAACEDPESFNCTGSQTLYCDE